MGVPLREYIYIYIENILSNSHLAHSKPGEEQIAELSLSILGRHVVFRYRTQIRAANPLVP